MELVGFREEALSSLSEDWEVKGKRRDHVDELEGLGGLAGVKGEGRASLEALSLSEEVDVKGHGILSLPSVRRD